MCVGKVPNSCRCLIWELRNNFEAAVYHRRFRGRLNSPQPRKTIITTPEFTQLYQGASWRASSVDHFKHVLFIMHTLSDVTKSWVDIFSGYLSVSGELYWSNHCGERRLGAKRVAKCLHARNREPGYSPYVRTPRRVALGYIGRQVRSAVERRQLYSLKKPPNVRHAPNSGERQAAP
ncbi:hypothetical protein BJV78DRAFT_845539 [Lactifluus subvellereus]|nr:hypothetical protein BJV78DRAFT_845539 [Lactifluus subvellereus]